MLGKGQGSGPEANHAAPAAGLRHVDVVVRVGLETRVVDLRMHKTK